MGAYKVLPRDLNPVSTAVPIWGQTIIIPSDLSPKRDWGPKGVKAIYAVIYLRFWSRDPTEICISGFL